MKNSNLAAAKRAKNDEFYTCREDIEAELAHYVDSFRGKTVYCNCDDPDVSEFWKFFQRNFSAWGLKRLIATHYEPDAANYSYMIEMNPGDAWDGTPVRKPIQSNGDFRSAACIELLQQADIVVTNPPFSLFREYMALLIRYQKMFLVMGNKNAFTYREIFPLVRDNRIWPGVTSINGGRRMIVPPHVASDKARLDAHGRRIGNHNIRLFQQNRDNFLNYELTVYVCQGTDKEKLDWFQVINIAGAVLTKQEIRNTLYHGSWLTDAKSAFSRRNCAAYRNYGKYMKGECIRQDYLETVFNWKADDEGITGKDAVVQFMQAHRYDANADDLWAYFEAVFDWVKHVFGSVPDKAMQGVAWGLLYNKHRHDNLDPVWMQQQVRELMANEEVTKKSGIYQYLLEGDEKFLQPRQFDKATAMTMYEKQGHRCAMCGEEKDFKDMHAGHIVPWSKGGKTEISNCQMLCIPCNEKKGNH